MANIVRLLSISIVSALLLLHARVAGAVCLDPISSLSGYRLPLEAEVSSADAIVIGRVLSVQTVQDDPADPEGVSADKLTVSVLDSLKGRLPKLIVIRNENSSARYAMSVGETHLLFVSRHGGTFWIDSCGNSVQMPDGERLVRRLRAELRKPLQD